VIERLNSEPLRFGRCSEDFTHTIKPKGGHPVLVPRSEYAKIRDQIFPIGIGSGAKVGDPNGKSPR
jgi:hypothetical protein